MTRLTTAGQDLELRWRRDNTLDLEPDDYLQLILRKTCCYTTIYPLRIGALVGSRGSVDGPTLEALSQFAFYLGAAFQIRDDLLNLVGSEERYGKEHLGDLHEGKRTLMLIRLLGEADATDRAWLGDLPRPPDRRASPRRGRARAHADGALRLPRRSPPRGARPSPPPPTWRSPMPSPACDHRPTPTSSRR